MLFYVGMFLWFSDVFFHENIMEKFFWLDFSQVSSISNTWHGMIRDHPREAQDTNIDVVRTLPFFLYSFCHGDVNDD